MFVKKQQKRVIVAKPTRLTHKVAIQLHLGAEGYTICSYLSRHPVRKLLDTPSYVIQCDTKMVMRCSEGRRWSTEFV